MRNLCTLPVSLSVLVCLLTCSAQAGTSVQCLENALPIEILGDDAEQRDTLLSQAEACMREAKPLRAVALLSQLIKTNPTDANTYINRGSAYSAAGDLGAAISDFSVAIRLDSDLVQAWYDRGTVLANMGRFESARLTSAARPLWAKSRPRQHSTALPRSAPKCDCHATGSMAEPNDGVPSAKR
jgi:tetratricopeptide (TPR) repeat protein